MVTTQSSFNSLGNDTPAPLASTDNTTAQVNIQTSPDSLEPAAMDAPPAPSSNLPKPPAWNEVVGDKDNAAKPLPPPPPSETGGFLNNSEVSLISRQEFLSSNKRKRQQLEKIANDKTATRSLCDIACQGIEACDKYDAIVSKGEELPEDEEVRIGSGNLLKKQSASHSSSNRPAKKQHVFVQESDEEEDEMDMSAQPDTEKPDDLAAVPNNETETNPAGETISNIGSSSETPAQSTQNLQLSQSVQNPAPDGMPCLKKYHSEAQPILKLFSTSLTLSAYDLAVSSTIHLFEAWLKHIKPLESYPSTLSQSIRFETCLTGLKEWVKQLESSDSNPFKAQVNEPYYSPEVINIPSTPTDLPKKGYYSFEDLIQLLLFPTEHCKCNWAHIWFQSISLVSQEVTPAPKFDNPVDPEDEIAEEIFKIQYFINCIKSWQNKPAITQSGENNLSNMPASDFKAIDNVVDGIYYMLIAFSILRAKHKINRATTTIAKYTPAFAKLPQQFTKRPAYHLLAAYLVSGIRGFLLIPDDQKRFKVTDSLQLISLISKINQLEPKDITEKIWKRTDSYVVSLIQQSFFDDKAFYRPWTSRFTLAKCLVLDFSDYWLQSVNTEENFVFSVPRKAHVGSITLQ